MKPVVDYPYCDSFLPGYTFYRRQFSIKRNLLLMMLIVIPCCQFTRSFASFLLSHIGLLSLVVGYCIMGAFIFEELEKVSIVFLISPMSQRTVNMFLCLNSLF